MTDSDGTDGGKAPFVGEESVEESSAPDHDLAAAGVLAALAVAAMWFAVRLEVPGDSLTAPGLLPILTGLSLLAMAAGLATKALRRGARFRATLDLPRACGQYLAGVENRRGLLLIAIIAAYVLVLDLVNFDLRLPSPIFEFRFSSYELVSFVALAGILRIFWRAGLARCLLLSAIWVVTLASVFRYGFHILLPGSG